MNRNHIIIALVLSAQWSGVVEAGQKHDGVLSLCECLKVERKDPLFSSCVKAYADVPSEEVEECKNEEFRSLANHIRSCTEIVQEFINQWTGEKLERRISGMKNGTCNYSEDIPNGGKMECYFPRERLDQIADYFDNWKRFDRAKVEINVSIVGGKESTKSRYFIDGKEVVNPMQVSLENGECTTRMMNP